MPNLLQKTLKVAVFALVIFWSFCLLWFLSLSYLPFSYWGLTQVKHLKNFTPFNLGYVYLFARPLSLIFPGQEGVLMMPLPRDVYCVAEKNYQGEATYEGYARVVSWDYKLVEDEVYYSLEAEFLSGKKETFLFTPEESQIFVPVKIEGLLIDNFYSLKQYSGTDLVGYFTKGELVRVRFSSGRSLGDYIKANEPTLEEEALIGIQQMPEWYRF